MKRLLFVLYLGLAFNADAVELGFEHSVADFNAALESGFYQSSSSDNPGDVPDVTHPWTHLIVARHSYTGNNYQLQLGSTYTNNDRLFFRKIENGNTPGWWEVATRNSNSFIGNQTVTDGSLNLNFTHAYGGEFPTDNSNYNNVLAIGGVGAELGLKVYRQNSGTGNTFLGENWVDTFVFELTDANGTDPDGGIIFGATGNDDIFEDIMTLRGYGFVGINQRNPAYPLDVAGTIRANEVIVETFTGADFVFEDDYNLMSLLETRAFIEANGHLPGIPSAEDMIENGISMGEMQISLLQKIEELTLHVLKQQEEIEQLRALIKGEVRE